MDKYASFNDLKMHEKEGTDYVIEMRTGSSGALIIAPHGGGIEPGTSDIADWVAGTQHDFYCLKGLKHNGNADLHISSDKFDEPNGLRMTAKAEPVLAIHGCCEADEVVFVGGQDEAFRKMLSDSISRAGFSVKEQPVSRLAGMKSTNICNRGRTRRGVQIEISRGLREKMFENLCDEGRRKKSKAFFHMVAAMRRGLMDYMQTRSYPIDVFLKGLKENGMAGRYSNKVL